jgi:hypothetical protein
MSAILTWSRDGCDLAFDISIKCDGVKFTFSPEGDRVEEYKKLLDAIQDNSQYLYDFGYDHGGGSIGVYNGEITFSMARHGGGNGGHQQTTFGANLFKDAIADLIVQLIETPTE